MYFLSLEDEQQLVSASGDTPLHTLVTATEESKDSGNPGSAPVSPLLQYSGRVHVRDVALMLEEILYFYRPHGAALTTAIVRDVLSRYDEWVVGAAEPLDLELLTAVSHLLDCGSSSSDDQESDNGAGPYSSIVERGHFQQHQLVSLIHFGKLAKELKPPSPVAQSPRRNSVARTVRISSTWSDIRIVLDDEAKRLLELETGIMSAAMRSLSGKQKLSIASRMEAKKRQEQVKVHIAHTTVHFDAFVAFLRAALLSTEHPTTTSAHLDGGEADHADANSNPDTNPDTNSDTIPNFNPHQPLQLDIADASQLCGDQNLFGLHN